VQRAEDKAREVAIKKNGNPDTSPSGEGEEFQCDLPKLIHGNPFGHDQLALS